MFKIFFTCLFLFTCFIAKSQNFDIQKVGMLQDKAALSDAVLFNNKLYAVETEGKSKFGWTLTINKVRMGCTIFAYDSTMALVNKNVLANGDDIYGPFQPFLKVLNNRLYLITYDFNKTDGIILNISRVDPNTLELSNTKEILKVSQRNAGVFGLFELYNAYKFLIKSSPDNSKILFLWSPGVTNSFSYSITDTAMNQLNTGSQEVANTTIFKIKSLVFDNGGNIFAAYNANSKYNYIASIIAIYYGGQTKINPLMLEDKQIESASILLTDNPAQLLILGPLRSKFAYVHGVYSMLMDKISMNNTRIKTREIPQELIKQFELDGYAKNKKKKNGLFPAFNFVGFSFDNGTHILAADLTRYKDLESTKDRMRSMVGIKGSTFIVAISASGEIDFERLPKREIRGELEDNAFFPHLLKNKLILFYTDTRENAVSSLERAETALYSSTKENVLVAATIDSKGTIVRTVLHPSSPDLFSFSPDNTSRVDDKTLLLGLEKDKSTMTRKKMNYIFYRLDITGN